MIIYLNLFTYTILYYFSIEATFILYSYYFNFINDKKMHIRHYVKSYFCYTKIMYPFFQLINFKIIQHSKYEVSLDNQLKIL